MNLKKAAAPFILRLSSIALRNTWINSNTKDRLWSFAQRYAAFFGSETKATIVNGMKMHVSSAPRVEQEVFLFGEWEPLFTRYLRSIPNNDGIFLDVGSNIGYFSLIASPIFKEVHAIEASPSTYRRLKGIVSENNINNIHIHNIAVGATEGHVDFYQDKGQSGAASTIKSDKSIFEAQVPMAPLEKILDGIDWMRVRFVKIDVEGLEAPVLDSLLRLSDSLPRDVEIFVEYDPARRDTWPSIEAFLNNGFSVAMMQGPYDRRDYVEMDRRTELEPFSGRPSMFCDLILRRTVDDLPASLHQK